ncbi:putative nucleocapsid [Plasmopara viticola lesion associated mymonavirus 1]|uniref:Putative nucleocapsid n=1 Tax=Plasmopara viticola lesion associated mymonavirus 1 TaxID=2692022 RepID=A0A6B9Q480_9MONO|nr:putative nucleocapsid [Plasmopara viticola lesion associated mymonavirus 1]QHD64781.1 putative nucleocapsid [Plasmopara viticola lesion associated mymonavirus 1]
MIQHGFIVLPPGHGKSMLHSPIDGIIEADTIVPCKSTDTLVALRAEARATGNWKAYDAEWVRLIKLKLPNYPCVILVPTFAVGNAGDWSDLGGAVLEMNQWIANLANRGEEPGWYIAAYNDTLMYCDTVPFSTNEELHEWVLKQVSRFGEYVGP